MPRFRSYDGTEIAYRVPGQPWYGAAKAAFGAISAGDRSLETSFSDGGCHLDPAAALAHARRLRADGADIIELGPAASHPGAVPVTAAEEQRRLAPVLEQLAADGVPVSVDSFQPETQRFAILGGAAYVNDIHGFGDPGTYPALAASE